MVSTTIVLASLPNQHSAMTTHEKLSTQRHFTITNAKLEQHMKMFIKLLRIQNSILFNEMNCMKLNYCQILFSGRSNLGTILTVLRKRVIKTPIIDILQLCLNYNEPREIFDDELRSVYIKMNSHVKKTQETNVSLIMFK